MICPKCKKQIDNDSQFCEFCGSKITKSKKGLWITLAVIAILVCIGVAGMYVYEAQQESLRIERQRLEEENRRAAEREAELKAQLEAERIAKEKAEQKAKAEAEKARMEAEKKAKAEAEARKEAERIAKAEAEARKEAERIAKAEAEKARKEAEQKAKEEDNIHISVEKMPEFPGGQEAFGSFLSRNLKYPLLAQENGIEGRVVCRFVVNKDGSISDIEVVKGVEESLDQEAIRVLKLMPKWIPGRQGGKVVRVMFTQGIRFKLQ